MEFLRIRRKRVAGFVPELFIAFAILCSSWFFKTSDHRIVADGRGYYDYLPSVFIRGDFVRSSISENKSMERYPELWMDDTYVTIDGKRVNKYFCGVSVLPSPFFLGAKMLSDAGDNGYSPFYETAILLGAAFYVFAGLIFLRRLLSLYGAKWWTILVTQIFIAFGTSIIFYTTLNFTFSHVYSFAAIAAFLFFAKKYFSGHTKRHFWLMALVFGIILLLRPVNILVVLFLPFIAGSWSGFKAGVRDCIARPKIILVGLLITATVYSIQPLLWFLQTGKFWIDTYAGEHFDFMHPHFFEFLFGFRKGVFVYAPVLILSLIGFIPVVRKFSWWTGLSLLFPVVLVTFILSSWHDPGYGASLGSRVFVDYYSLLAIPMAILIGNLRWGNVAVGAFGVLCIYVSVIQTWQYPRYILNWMNMDFEKYRLVFLKTDEQYKGVLWKPAVTREWNETEQHRIDSFTQQAESFDTLFYGKYAAATNDRPGLILLEFENEAGFTGEELAKLDVTVSDSLTGVAQYYRSTWLFHFRESENSDHGSYFYDIPAPAETTGRMLMIRVFTMKNPVKLRNIGIKMYGWKE